MSKKFPKPAATVTPTAQRSQDDQRPQDNWRKLNFNAACDLPPPGIYLGRISDVKVSEKEDVIWLIVDYHIDNCSAAPQSDILAICATEVSAHAKRVVEGRRRLTRLQEATGIDLGDEPQQLPSLLIGHPVKLVVVHKKVDGLPVLVVRDILPAA
jgi:hypothetical protein